MSQRKDDMLWDDSGLVSVLDSLDTFIEDGSKLPMDHLSSVSENPMAAFRVW